jgi:hypothetical protein
MSRYIVIRPFAYNNILALASLLAVFAEFELDILREMFELAWRMPATQAYRKDTKQWVLLWNRRPVDSTVTDARRASAMNSRMNMTLPPATCLPSSPPP